jgi:hypothetical protein
VRRREGYDATLAVMAVLVTAIRVEALQCAL